VRVDAQKTPIAIKSAYPIDKFCLWYLKTSNGYFRYLTNSSSNQRCARIQIHFEISHHNFVDRRCSFFFNTTSAKSFEQKTIVAQQKPDDFTCSVVFKRINNNQFQHTDLERKPRLFANFYKNEY